MSLVGGYHSQSYHHHHPHHTAHHSGGPTTTNGGLSPDYMTTGYGASAHTRSPYACNDPLSTAGGVVSPHDPPALPGAGVGCAGSSPSAMPGAPASSGAAGYFHHHASAVAPSWMLSPVAAAHEAAHAGGGAGGSSGVDAYGFPAPAGLNAPDYTGHAAAAMFGMAVDHAGTVYVARTGHRAVKRRGAANRKERRRTLSINTAFSNLRGCIPNVPTDTKLSKIKTLRLATSYIGYLMDVLNEDDPALAEAGFKAELTKKVDREERRRREAEELAAARAAEKLKREASTSPSSAGGGAGGDKKHRGRTGWPQHVWAAELGNVTAEATAGGGGGGGGAGSGSGGSNTLNTPQHEHPHHIPQNTGV